MQPNNQQNGQPAPGQPMPQAFASAPAQAAGQPAPQASASRQPTTQAPVGSNQQTGQQPTPKNQNSTQSTLQLSEVRDNLVVMTDGSFRAVVACQSINFDLMSDREREGVEFSYQNFLNSLNFPIQILVRSQRIDIGPYINKLLDSRRSQDNMLLGVLMDDYINFIDILSQEANIMEKSFYIIVPYYPQGDANTLVDQGKGFFGKLFGKPKATVTRIDGVTYQKAKDELKNRVESVRSGLFQIGVHSQQLDTKALGELYYNYYNPDTAVNQPLVNFEDVTATYVQKAPTQATPNRGAA